MRIGKTEPGKTGFGLKGVFAAWALAAGVLICNPAEAIDDITGYVVLTNSDVLWQSASFSSGTWWSDGLAPSKGKKYLVQGGRGLSTPLGKQPAPFGGDSLTIDGGGNVFLASAPDSTISANWILYGGWIALRRAVTYTVAGNIDVRSTKSNYAVFHARESGTVKVSAPLSGPETAVVYVRVHDDNLVNKSATISFSGDNSNYRGRFRFQGWTSGCTGYLVFDGAKSTGVSGNPSEGAFLYVENGNTIPVIELKNVQMDSKFTINNGNSRTRINLKGDDVLFGATITGTQAPIAVDGGASVILQSGSALSLSIADGAHLLVKLNADGTSTASSLADGTVLTLGCASLPVTIKGSLQPNSPMQCDIVEVPASLAETVGAALGDTATFVDESTGRSRSCPIKAKTLDGGRVRFCADIRKGFVLIVF